MTNNNILSIPFLASLASIYLRRAEKYNSEKQSAAAVNSHASSPATSVASEDSSSARSGQSEASGDLDNSDIDRLINEDDSEAEEADEGLIYALEDEELDPLNTAFIQEDEYDNDTDDECSLSDLVDDYQNNSDVDLSGITEN